MRKWRIMLFVAITVAVVTVLGHILADRMGPWPPGVFVPDSDGVSSAVEMEASGYEGWGMDG